jgi:oligoendopeptidase F
MTNKDTAQSIDSQDTWDLTSIFALEKDWEKEFESLKSEMSHITIFKNRLAESPQSLLDCLTKNNQLNERCNKLYTYVSLKYYQDTRSGHAKVMLDRATMLSSQRASESAFIRPEILSIGTDRLASMMQDLPALQSYSFYFHEIKRHSQHTRSPEVEELISNLHSLSDFPESVFISLNNGDLRFSPIQGTKEQIEISHGSFDETLHHTNRDIRRAAYNSYTDAYLAHSQTFADALTGKANVSHKFAKARRYDSTLTQVLSNEDISKDVFDRVLQVCHEHRPLFQRYFRARAAILKITKVAEYDFLAPLCNNSPSFPYEQGKSLVLDALLPLGKEYVDRATHGLTVERWADVYPAPGKYSNAFSSGTYGTRPFLLINYSPNMTEVGTLAHELGHSMHSLITNRSQPIYYSNYSMMVAETASNLNQVLLRDHILKSCDREIALSVLEEAFYFAHRYLFLFPTLSQIEHSLHSAYAAGCALGASDLSKETVATFSAAYGDAVDFEEARLGTKWSQFGHFYVPFYFFQYAVGISSAMAIGKRIIDKEPGIQEKYLKFLSAGASLPTTEIFKLVDIDITSAEPYREAFKVVEGYLERLEELSK